MEKNKVKLGVVGLLRGRDIIANSMEYVSGFNLRAICDRDPERLRSAKTLFESKGANELLCFTELDDMLASDIDAILIATDENMHVPHVIRALDAGKHVLSEIPAVDSVEEARILRAAVKSHPELKYMVAENACFFAFIDSWKKMYEDGKFGEVVYAESEYLHARAIEDFKPYPKGHWRQSLNSIRYLTHNLGPLLYILGDRCVSVSCIEPEFRYNPYRTGAENGIALFKTAAGRAIRIFIGHGVYVGFDHNFAMFGTRGSIHTDRSKSFKVAHSFAKLHEIPGSMESPVDIPVTTSYNKKITAGHGGADAKMLEEFVSCIINDTPSPVDVELGIDMAIPGIYAHESALRGGEVVEIPEI